MNPRRPNILLYCTDQQRFDTIGALGNPHVQTPTLDRLVNTGTAFTHTYCQSPICTPSRSSLMTGLYPSRVHNTRNGNATFPDHPPLISKLIADSGYDCGMIGKFHLQSSGHRTEPRLDDGFRVWQFSHAPRDEWPRGEHDYADWVREKGGDLTAMRESPDRVPAEFHQTTWATQRAIEFIDDAGKARADDQPWFLNLNIYDPHPPFIPPKAYEDRFDPATLSGPHFEPDDLKTQEKLKAADFQGEVIPPEERDAKADQARYYAMIALIDDQLARLLAHLDASGQAENTIIIFTSDHGETLGDHGLMFKGCRFYEGLVRVPLIFHAPGKVAEKLQSDALVELLDLSATLLDLTGVALPAYHQGKSLLPILSGKASPDTHRDFVRCEYFDALAPDFTGGHGAFATMHRTRSHKLSLYHSIGGVGELYDLSTDPWEHRDLWDNPDSRETRDQLILQSFDAHVMLTTDVGSERIAPM
ncbi:MAG: sulfatase-like hydrolase/transferase [Verrucomicrobiae bacterium]|nr:sulfatase-like hydrolase/transferase [Verrucomicrobiae bacterium]